MVLNFGKDKWDKSNNSKNVIWDSEKVINGHMMLVGASGTGKTYRIRKMINELRTQDKKIKFHILDVHGDIEIENQSSVKFSEVTEYGINPLKISPDEDFGGIRKKIRSFVSMINRTSRQLGSKQESVLISLLTDLYRELGFDQGDNKTWKLDCDPRVNPKNKKRFPNMLDLKRYTYYKLTQMITGSGTVAQNKLDILNKKFKALDRAKNKAEDNGEDDIEKEKDECKKAYNEYIDNIETGREIDEVIKYDSKEVIKSVYERITNLESSGIFKPQNPPFDSSKNVWRYNIKALNKDEQKMFVDIMSEMIFLSSKQKGISDKLKHIIIIDEAHIFMTSEDDHILNVISKEARKYGVGLWLASQSFTHFTDDIISNTSCKVVLGIDEMFHDGSAKKLRIEAKRFSYIVPHRTGMIQIKNKGDISNKFVDTEFI